MSQSDAKGGVHPTVQRLESQVLLRIMFPNKLAHSLPCLMTLCMLSCALEQSL